MLDDFTPIIHELPGRTVKLWAVADVHLALEFAGTNSRRGNIRVAW